MKSDSGPALKESTYGWDRYYNVMVNVTMIGPQTRARPWARKHHDGTWEEGQTLEVSLKRGSSPNLYRKLGQGLGTGGTKAWRLLQCVLFQETVVACVLRGWGGVDACVGACGGEKREL